jgi:hypothetical protein
MADRLSRRTWFGLAAAVVVLGVLGLFLLPVVPITVVFDCSGGMECPVGVLPVSASASVTYAYFGFGTVQVPNTLGGGHSYCLMYGNPGTMCGFPLQRMS